MKNTRSMKAIHVACALLATLILGGPKRDERGLSQSTENAILLAGAAAIAGTVVTVITLYVTNRLPK